MAMEPPLAIDHSRSTPTLSETKANKQRALEADPAAIVTREICGSTKGCKLDAMEPLPLTSGTTRALLVRTTEASNASATGDATPIIPDYWIATVDPSTNSVKHQYLVNGFKKGAEPNAEELWPTFTLSFDDATHATLNVTDPSQQTAWGRRGFVRFSWPDFNALEWEYRITNFLNPDRNSTTRWDWRTRTGSSLFHRCYFRYVVPRIPVDPQFAATAWRTVDFSACSSKLDKTTGAAHRGEKLAPYEIRALLTAENELFMELLPLDATQPSSSVTVTVCYAEVLRFEPETPSTKPPCTIFKIADGQTTSPVRIEKAEDRLRYKLLLPYDKDLGELGLTITLNDSRLGQSLSSSPYVPKTSQQLGATVNISGVRCTLNGPNLESHFEPVDQNSSLLDNLL
jgi:hypothetical protein